MRKIINSTLALTVMAVVFTGCFKDKEYGTNVMEVKGVAFPQAVPLGAGTLPGDSVSLTLGVASQVAAITLSDVNITLEADQPATEDITINIAINNALVPVDADLGLTKLATGEVSIPATVVIPKGATKVSIPITLTNTSLLDATATFAVGISITGVSSGLKIASNKRNIVVAFNIKNKYDGVYTLAFKYYHPTNNPTYSGTTIEVYMITSGPNSVKIYDPTYFDAYISPTWNNGTISGFASQEPEYTVDPVTNKVTVQNSFPGAATFYKMNLLYDSHWDDATKVMYAKWGYNYKSDGSFDPANNREWEQVFTYKGPRP